MSTSFSAVTPDRESEVSLFLGGIFGLTGTEPNHVHSARAWKYFDPHPWWPNGRSYILETSKGIASHGCVSPVRFGVNGGVVESMQIIDWAASRAVPGAGLMVFRRCMEASGAALLTIGGSADTLKVVSRVKWFRRKEDFCSYARPIRSRRLFARSRKSVREMARLARNFQWQLTPSLPGAGTWQCRVARPGEGVFSPAGDFVPIVRTRAWFDYLLRCPVVQTELVILERAGVASGHAFLANAAGAVKVADFVVAGDLPRQERASAFSALARYIAANPEAAEISTASSLPEMWGVFEDCGLRRRSVLPVYLADLREQFPEGARLEITPLIGDLFYLYDPAWPFSC